MASEIVDSPSSSRSSSQHRDEESGRRFSTWSNSLDHGAGATSAGQPSLFRMLNVAAQYSHLALSEDSSETDSDSAKTPASETAADMQTELATNDNLKQEAFPAPETALAALALRLHDSPRADSIISLQRLTQYAVNAETTSPQGVEKEVAKGSEEHFKCDPTKVSDHAVALKILQHEFGELTQPGEVEEMILVRRTSNSRSIRIFGIVNA
jgi:hypothetical protein